MRMALISRGSSPLPQSAAADDGEAASFRLPVSICTLPLLPPEQCVRARGLTTLGRSDAPSELGRNSSISSLSVPCNFTSLQGRGGPTSARTTLLVAALSVGLALTWYVQTWLFVRTCFLFDRVRAANAHDAG